MRNLYTHPYRVGSNQYRTRYNNNLKPKTWASIVGIVLFFSIPVTISWYNKQLDNKLTMLERSVTVNVYASTDEPTFEDTRAQKIYTYLKEQGSPLAPFADLMVRVADENAIDWTIIPAIAGKESSFGKAIKPGSHNAWGIMAWDAEGNRSIRMFKTWAEGIEFTGGLLGKHYRRDMYSAVQARYCPSFECSDTWVENVSSFSERMQGL